MNSKKTKLLLKSNENLMTLKVKEVDGVPDEILIFSLGKTDVDYYGHYKVDEKSIDKIIEKFKNKGVDLVWDYEHQTLKDVLAPAAGWTNELIKIDDGLIAKVKWTEKAKKLLKNKEYRYYSPVIQTDKDRRVIGIHSIALTNSPKTHLQKPLVAKNTGKEEGMNEEILKALGLEKDADEKAVLSAISALKEQPNEKEVISKEVKEALKLKEDATQSEVVASIHALKQTADNVSVEDYQTLKARLDKQDAETAVSDAMTKGKISPAQKDWALKYATDDLEGFKSFVEKAPVVVPLKNLPSGTPKEGNEGLTSIDMEVAKCMDVDAEDIKKYGGE